MTRASAGRETGGSGRRLIAALAMALTLPGCATTAYYWQAARGHLQLIADARPVSELVADPATPERLRDKLTLSARIRDFASRELALPDNASYRSYVALDRPFVVWNVIAAPEFSLRPEEWCFPVAGCVQYRGYFGEAAARDEAVALQKDGRDIYVSGVPAYSTLGWFDDPLLSSFIQYPEAELARLIFHELAHQVAYVKDDSVFNESFAVAVENEGVRRWTAAAGRSADLARFVEQQQRRRQFAALVERARQRLQAVFDAPAEAADKRERKQRVFDDVLAEYARLKQTWGGYAGFDRWVPARPNNAWLAALNTYARRVPAFERVLADCAGALPCFYARVGELARLPRRERDERLDALEKADGTAAGMPDGDGPSNLSVRSR